MKGPGSAENHFNVHVVRCTPATVGEVTGKQTFFTFLSSLLGKNIKLLLLFVLSFIGARDKGAGIHLC